MKASRMCSALVSVLSLAACISTPEIPDTASNHASALSGALPYRGVNLSSAEFASDPWGNGKFPGTPGTDYVYPDPAYVPGYNGQSYFVGKGMTTFRLPFRWERLQPTLGAPLASAELTRLTTTVNDMVTKGAYVILDPHNYARYMTNVVGSSALPNQQFADFWSRVATQFKSNSHVIFGLMNEPHDLPTEQWAGAANAAIAAIRATGATNLILVPGNGYTGGAGWTNPNLYGTANSVAMLQVTDPGNNYAFEVHQYLDADSSGGSPTCVSTTIGSQRLSAFTSWLRANGKRGFLGEFAGGSDATCLAAIDDMLRHIEANQDVYVGWTYWAGGPWWGSYVYSLEPSGSADKPQMQTLLPHLSWSAPTSSGSSSSGSPGSGSSSSGSSSSGSSSSGSSSSGSTCGGSSGGGSSSSSSSSGGTCATVSYSAATMYHSVGAPVAGGWNIYSNGYASQNHTFVGGPTKVTVYAAGQVAAGVWPHMYVTVDGTQIGDVNVSYPYVDAQSWAPYGFTFNATAGTHEIRVYFDNNDYVNGQDRNLLIEKVDVSCN